MSKPLIPFFFLPHAWFLRGNDYKIAEARYNFKGEELDKKIAEITLTGKDLSRRLVEIGFDNNQFDAFMRDTKLLEIDGKHEDDRSILDLRYKHHQITEYEYDAALVSLDHPKSEREEAMLGIELKHNRITAYEHDVKVAELDKDNRERKLLDVSHAHGRIDDYDYEFKIATLEIADEKKREEAIIELRKKYGRINETEYNKAMATARDEPWIEVVDSGFDPEKGINGVYFEFDWNEQWITHLRAHGYSGVTDSAIIDMWFTDVCRAQGMNPHNSPFSL